MEQTFVLQFHCRISLEDQRGLTAEERAWYVKRMEREYAERAEAMEKAKGRGR